VADLYIPASGEIVEINHALDGDPGLVNNSPMDDGWLFKVKLADPGELDSLLDAAGYEELLG
jgi:glycine cleavage system H protein